MAEMQAVDRIAPPVPPLPAPVGRSVGSRQKRDSRNSRRPPAEGERPADPDRPQPHDRIDEYV